MFEIRSSLVTTRKSSIARLSLAAAMTVLSACESELPPPCTPTAAQEHQEILIGYELLKDTLADESKLHLLKLFKDIFAEGTVQEIEDLMGKISDSSNKRGAELKKQRELAPDVTGKPAHPSPIGDKITAVAKKVGQDELMKDDPAYGLRFLLLQAQATRMVAAISIATSEFDANTERRKWLGAVAEEYEDYRDEVIAIIRKYVRGEGDAQKR